MGMRRECTTLGKPYDAGIGPEVPAKLSSEISRVSESPEDHSAPARRAPTPSTPRYRFLQLR